MFAWKEARLRTQRGTHYSKRLGLELCAEPSVPTVNTAPAGGQMGCLRGKRQGLELSAELSVPPVNTVPAGGQTESL